MRRFTEGDKVICVNDNLFYKWVDPITKGQIYTISDYTFYDNKHYYQLEECQNPIQANWYAERYFEPLTETTNQFVAVTFEKILESQPISAS